MLARFASVVTTLAFLLWLPVLSSAQNVEINPISNSSLVYLETLRISWTGGGGGPANVTVQESTGDKRMWFVARDTRTQYADWVVNATVGSSVGIGVAQNGYSGSFLGRTIPIVASAADATASQTTSAPPSATSSTAATSSPTSGALSGMRADSRVLFGLMVVR